MGHPRRAFVDLDLDTDPLGSRVVLSDNDSEHFNRVLRLKEGDLVTLVCKKRTQAFKAQIIKPGKQMEVELTELLPEKVYRSPVLSICCALLKGDHNDLIVEKATELGVSRIFFFESDRSILKVHNESKRTKKEQRWKAIAEASAKQSSKLFCPEVKIIASLKDYIETCKSTDAKILYGALEQEAHHIGDLDSSSKKFHLVIGPEGDFSAAELQLLKKALATPISFGPFVLKAETAAICGISALTTWSQILFKQNDL